VGVYTYFAEDPVTGRVEREYDHVLLGQLPIGTTFRPDPAEVARLLWVSLPDLQDRLANDPGSYAPWLGGVTACLVSHLSSPTLSQPLPSLSQPVPSLSQPLPSRERSGGE
jgi:isopentenyl-diphosphate delta-isomerase